MLDISGIDRSSLAIGAVVLVLLVQGVKWATKRSTPRFRGPPGTSLMFGVTGDLLDALDSGVYHDKWIQEYGSVYELPAHLGSTHLVVADPKAIASFFSKDTTTYHQLDGVKVFVTNFFGKNLLVTEAPDHKRIRRALSTAFSVAAIRRLTPIFMDAVNQVKANWENAVDASSTKSEVIEVQQWMNNIALDTVGIGGFSHDFGAIRGNQSAVLDAFALFGDLKPSFTVILSLLLSQISPSISKLFPTKRGELMQNLSDSVREIAVELFKKAKDEKTTEKSIIGTLVRSETASSAIQLSIEEIMNQMVRTSHRFVRTCLISIQKLLMIAGYETTAVSITYALIELARHPEVQEKLRAELTQFAGTDATYEQLTTGLPYLDAVTNEVMRLHPAGPELMRQTMVDDVLPLTEPVTDRNGKRMDSLFVAKGTLVRIPTSSVNRMESLWGPDSKDFNPDRWLNSELSEKRAMEISGYHHILTFADGPRSCLGRAFALTEFKSVLSVLARDFTFEIPGGSDRKLELHRSILPRPKLAGEEGAGVPLIIRRAAH